MLTQQNVTPGSLGQTAPNYLVALLTRQNVVFDSIKHQLSENMNYR